MELQHSVPLAPKTTLGVGGAARELCVARSESDVAEAVARARAEELDLHVLGGGSNLVVSDAGVEGLTLAIALRGVDWGAEGRVTAAAGEPWDAFVAASVERGLAGLECLSGIPGLVGATPIQNVGAYGQEVSERIARVRALDRESGAVVELGNAECRFAYRDSYFKSHAPGRFVVLAVEFRLIPGGAPALRYPELERELAERGLADPTLEDVRQVVLALRGRKSMLFDPSDENGRSCGSFFVNPIVEPALADEVGAQTGDPSMPRYPQADGRVKLSAAWLIERAGLAKGTRDGNVGLSTKHTLCIVAHPGAGADEVVRFAARVRRTVQERFGVRLEPEPVFWGFAQPPMP